MNDIRQQQRRLVEDVTAENEDFIEFQSGLKRQALAQFRQAVIWRKVRRVFSCTAAFLLLGCLVWIAANRSQDRSRLPVDAGEQPERTQHNATAAPESSTALAKVGQTPPSPETSSTNAFPVRLLSDSELLAVFPPNSCFLAEVDGKTIVVFDDPEMEKRFFR